MFHLVAGGRCQRVVMIRKIVNISHQAMYVYLSFSTSATYVATISLRLLSISYTAFYLYSCFDCLHSPQFKVIILMLASIEAPAVGVLVAGYM